MRSPDRKLLPQEIARKKKKLSKTLNQLEGLTEGTRKHHRKSFKAEKTLDQVTTGRSGIRPNKSALNMLGVSRNEYGESRGENHDVNKRFGYDPADKKAFMQLNQKTKDSLHGEANKYGKPFFSPKHGVNVDPEDGVLSNRPVYSDNTKLTYDKIDKPFSESGINRNETKTDSLGHDAAWAKWEKGYMDRTHKMKGTKFEKPITPEENRKEMESERGEFMYDKAKGQIRLRKTDDAENPIERQTSYGESRGENHDIGKRFGFDPADKKAFQALNQKTKDSLHMEANKYGKPFFSPKFGVNVDPEDGVLSNRPVYSDNTKLTYDKIDKPFSESGIKRKSALNMVGLGVSRNSRCWEGYEPTPGVKPYAKGSCRKK